MILGIVSAVVGHVAVNHMVWAAVLYFINKLRNTVPKKLQDSPLLVRVFNGNIFVM